MAELRTEAARHGDEITVWYDDLGISGRGEFYDLRISFGQLLRDAKAGLLRRVFTRDLSRLFRDVTGQELWIAEMESLGVEVVASDLPLVADASTRQLLRQQIGSIHEYLAARQGAITGAIRRERVYSGLWVGRQRSCSGLRYDKARKGFLLDPATADQARIIFEVFNASGGMLSFAAWRLQRMLEAGHPRVGKPPAGGKWTLVKVRWVVQNPLYRRATFYSGRTIPLPELIPEVIAPDVITQTDRLLEMEKRDRTLLATHVKAATAPGDWFPGWQMPGSTYMYFLRCANCGGLLEADYLPCPRRMAGGSVVRVSPTSVSWHCDTPPGSAPTSCTRASFASPRLDILVGRAIREALRLYGHHTGFGAPELTLDVKQSGKKVSKEYARKRSDEGFVGLPKSSSVEAIQDYKEWATVAKQVRIIKKLSGQEDALLAIPGRWEALQNAGLADASRPRPITGQSVRPEPRMLFQPSSPNADLWQTLSQRAALLWPAAKQENKTQEEEKWNLPLLEEDKRVLLRELGIWISIQVLPRTRHHMRVSRSLCQLSGRLVISLNSPALGFVDKNAYLLLEGNTELLDFRKWQHRRVGPPRSYSSVL